MPKKGKGKKGAKGKGKGVAIHDVFNQMHMQHNKRA
jgi:hypothetical protein